MRARSANHSIRRRRIVVVAIALVVGTLVAAPSSATGVVHGAVVEEVPRNDTPEFLDNEVRATMQVGNRIIVGGDFTQVRDDTHGVVNQPYLAAYDLTTGRLDMNFRPLLDDIVHSIADAGDGTIIAVGKFKTVSGEDRKRVAKIRVVDGSVVTQIKANASSTVNDVAVAGGKVYFGGSFAKVNNTPREALAAVDLATGDLDPGFDLPITEATGLNGAGGVRAVDVSPDGDTLLTAHNAHRVDGLVRQGVALIDISGPTAAVKTWKTDHFDYDCQPWFASFTRPLMRDAQFSPDGSYFVAVTSIGNFAPGCDVAVRFPTSGGTGVTATWVSRLFDTPEAVAITDKAIYIGGHMRWLQAPGTVWNQWSNGNTNTQPPNTVLRDQIGALSPADGTALPWDPGASGHRGVLELRVTDAGLLAGSDGEWFGGRRTYRHALFELPDGPPPADTANPTTSISAPADGGVLSTSQVAIAGTAGDDNGVVDVRVNIRNTVTNEYLQLDGSLAPGWVEHPTFVPASGDPSTGFSWTANLPDGSYRLRARAIDVVGKADGSPAAVNFVVNSAGDVEDPEGVIDVPNPNQVFASNPLAFSGSAMDDTGVAEANLIIKDRGTGKYLQDNGSMGTGWNAVPAIMGSPGATTTMWTWNGSLPDGSYRVNLQVKDVEGKQDPSKARQDFTVDATPDTKNPQGVLDVPVPGQVFNAVPVAMSGSASDDTGVRRVTLIIKDRDTGKYLQDNGSMGNSWNAVRAALGSPKATDTTWSWSGPIPNGRYVVKVHVKDVAGKKDPTKASARFRVAA